MNFKLRNLVAATLAGSFLMGFGVNAMADSTTDIVNALVAKGVLTEEEGALLTKGRTEEAAGQAKALKKASKLKVSDAIDNATVYGDIRVRFEDRTNDAGTGVANAAISETKLGRARYKMTLGVKTEAGNWYSDLAMVMGAKGRSDNADFGSLASNEVDSKQALFLKRATVGFKATDWLAVEAGRMNNPLYTSSMVWDADLNVEGLVEKATFKVGDADVFLTAVQSEYMGVRKLVGGVPSSGAQSTAFGVAPTSGAAMATAAGSAQLFAFQAGLRKAFNDNTSAKAALTYSAYSKNPYSTNFGASVPNGGTATTTYTTTGTSPGPYVTTASTATTAGAANSSKGNLWGVNDLNIIEIPAEVNYMAAGNVGVRLFEHFAINTSADDRARNSGIATAVNGSSGSDNIAWSLGLSVGSAKDLKAFEGNKMAKGDWNTKLWYQSVGIWSVDSALVDSDIFDGRVNMKGTTFKAQYNVEDNVALNFTAAHGDKKNTSYYAMGIGDLSGDLTKLNLMQFDVTYKF